MVTAPARREVVRKIADQGLSERHALRVIGMNSIAAYMIAHLIEGFLRSNFHTFLGEELFYMAGNAYEPLVSGGAVLAIYWLILFWMARRKLFLRI